VSTSFAYRISTVDGVTGGTITGDLQLNSTFTIDTAGDPERLEVIDNASMIQFVADGAAGNVGIGITAPMEKLDVVGNIKAIGLTINNEALPSNEVGDVQHAFDTNDEAVQGMRLNFGPPQPQGIPDH